MLRSNNSCHSCQTLHPRHFCMSHCARQQHKESEFGSGPGRPCGPCQRTRLGQRQGRDDKSVGSKQISIKWRRQNKYGRPCEAPEEPKKESDAMIGDVSWNSLGPFHEGKEVRKQCISSTRTCENGGATIHRSVKRGLLRSGLSVN